AGPELRELADEANRLNETCRIYVNLMAANVRRRLQLLTGESGAGYRPVLAGAYA
ncbi:MAG TPA: flagellar protein FlgN, partial [Sphingomonas sp.]|nr:flagellar protein FlgN [Sphingomonas sp.]